MDKKKFAKVAINENTKTFVVHISVLQTTNDLIIHLSQAAQIATLQ